MKKNILFFVLMIALSSIVFSQSPQAITYQAVAGDSTGGILVDHNLGIRISILQGNIGGSAVYVEIHDIITNQLGLINLTIGTGTIVSGDFASINWGSSLFYMKTEIDTSGGSNYIFMETTLLETIPYALHSNALTLTDANGVSYHVTVDTLGNLITTQINLWECGLPITDERYSQVYATVQIGDQCWLAENMNIGVMITGIQTQKDNDLFEKYCYDNLPANCETYGGLYQWNEMMQYDTNRYNTGICPAGWRLPTAVEWDSLVTYLGGETVAGDALKQNGTSGFEALLAGKRLADGSFISMNSTGSFWTSSQINSLSSNFRYLNDGDAGFYEDDTLKTLGLAVRCLKGLPNVVDTGVVIIDTMVYMLISDSAQLAQGIYKYEIQQRDEQDSINLDNIIIGITDEGYLRKVLSKTQTGNELTLETSQATMEDVWYSGEFAFEADLTEDTIRGQGSQSTMVVNYLAKGVTINQTRGGFRYDFNNVILHQDGSLTLSIPTGHVELDPEYNFEFKFEDNVVQELGFYTGDAPWETNYDVSLNVTQATGLLNDEIMLASVTHLVDYMVGIVPITIVINTDLIAVSTVNSDTVFSATTGHTNTNLLSIGVIYEDNFWSNIWDFSESTSLHALTISGQGNLTQQVSLIPQISIKMYGVDGPYFDTELYGEFLSNFDPDLLNWDMEQNVGLNADVGAEVTIFGNALPDYNDQLVGFEQTLWSVPDELIYVSGNYQTGDTNQLLTNPVKVKVEDKSGNTWANVPVQFNVIGGGGTVSDESIMTDANGYAQTNWTMGPVVGQNTLSVLVVKADGVGITGSPMQFTAYATGGGGGGQPCPGIPTVYYEGQTYNTVLIGNQCWLKENLNVGTMIPGSQNMADNGTIEKYCYNNDPANCATYGGLYQWNEMMQYVTTQGAQGICPSGWHIPTDDEWKILEGTVDSQYPVGDPEWDQNGYRGYDAGYHLKSTTGWYNNGNGDDSFGFTAFPGGYWYTCASCFLALGDCAIFWTSTEHNGTFSWIRALDHDTDDVGRGRSYRMSGYSVRCLQD